MSAPFVNGAGDCFVKAIVVLLGGTGMSTSFERTRSNSSEERDMNANKAGAVESRNAVTAAEFPWESDVFWIVSTSTSLLLCAAMLYATQATLGSSMSQQEVH